jgi:osmotically inducible lipoprotein OsmB
MLYFNFDDLIGDNMKFAKTIVMTAITSSALIMTGCNSTGGYGGGNVSNTAKGAAAGAAAGALIRSKGDSKDIARGALAGAALGGAGGYIIDNN